MGAGGWGVGRGGDVQSNVNEHSLNGGLGVVGSKREREREISREIITTNDEERGIILYLSYGILFLYYACL